MTIRDRNEEHQRGFDMPDLGYSSGKLLKDLSAGLVVFFVALPLCLGIANASRVLGVDPTFSNVPMMAGLLTA